MGTTKFKFWQRKRKGKVKRGTKSNRKQKKERGTKSNREREKKLEMSNLIYVRKSKVETSRNGKREKKSSGIK